MGLDITAYKNIEVSKVTPELNSFDEPVGSYTQVWINPDFPYHAKGLSEDVYYHYDEECHFLSMPYSSYGSLRNSIAAMAGYERTDSPDAVGREYVNTVWNIVYEDNKAIHYGKPLTELLAFSDCEGVIDNKTCKKIYNDLKAISNNKHMLDEYMQKKFDCLLEAFEFASHNGFVEYG